MQHAHPTIGRVILERHVQALVRVEFRPFCRLTCSTSSVRTDNFFIQEKIRTSSAWVFSFYTPIISTYIQLSCRLFILECKLCGHKLRRGVDEIMMWFRYCTFHHDIRGVASLRLSRSSSLYTPTRCRVPGLVQGHPQYITETRHSTFTGNQEIWGSFRMLKLL